MKKMHFYFILVTATLHILCWLEFAVAVAATTIGPFPPLHEAVHEQGKLFIHINYISSSSIWVLNLSHLCKLRPNLAVTPICYGYKSGKIS